VLSSGTNEISVFQLEAHGGLTPITGIVGLPPTANGMAAR